MSTLSWAVPLLWAMTSLSAAAAAATTTISIGSDFVSQLTTYSHHRLSRWKSTRRLVPSPVAVAEPIIDIQPPRILRIPPPHPPAVLVDDMLLQLLQGQELCGRRSKYCRCMPVTAPKTAWATETMVSRRRLLARHPETGRRLLWLRRSTPTISESPPASVFHVGWWSRRSLRLSKKTRTGG